MAIEKVFRCDLDGNETPRDAVTIVRVGTLADRPEDCERFELGPCCVTHPFGDLLKLYAERVNE